MTVFLMPTSRQTFELLDAIAEQMVSLFSVSRDEAVARINQQWHAHDLSSEEDLILHEDAYYWAMPR